MPNGMELTPKCSLWVFFFGLVFVLGFFAFPSLLGAELMAFSPLTLCSWRKDRPAGLLPAPLLQHTSPVLDRLQHAICSYLFHFCGFICIGGMGFAPLVFDTVFKLDEESSDTYDLLNRELVVPCVPSAHDFLLVPS